MNDLIYESSEVIAIDVAFTFDSVSAITTDVMIEGNTAIFDVSASGSTIIVDVHALAADGSSGVSGYLFAQS